MPQNRTTAGTCKSKRATHTRRRPPGPYRAGVDVDGVVRPVVAGRSLYFISTIFLILSRPPDSSLAK